MYRLMWPFLLLDESHDMIHTGFRRLTVVNGTLEVWGFTDMNPDERTDHRATCRASKANEGNQQQEEGFMRDKRKIGKSFNLNSLL